MRQVLFFIPLKAIADALPDVPWFAYAALGALAIGVGGWLDRRAREQSTRPAVPFSIIGAIVPVLFIAAAAIKFFGGVATVPIYGYGARLFVAFVVCTWLARRLAAREGVDPIHVENMAIWIFVFGIIGARLTFMFLAEPKLFSWGSPRIVLEFFRVWDGGLVFYGSAIGGVVGYYVAYWLVLRKHGISSWKMADIVAPCAALGLAIGRVGCLLNGCCYGNVVVCENCPGLSFPLSSPPRAEMVSRGYQTAAGFTLKSEPTPGGGQRTLETVEPAVKRSLNDRLREGDTLLKVNSKNVDP